MISGFKIIGYSRCLAGGGHDYGTLRVSRYEGNVKYHVFTPQGWCAKALDEQAESICVFCLSMRSTRYDLKSHSNDGRTKLTVRLGVAGWVNRYWSVTNDVGEWLQVEESAVNLETRCDLLAACATIGTPDEKPAGGAQ